MTAIQWYGGKAKHLSWLMPLLPACHHYCEPFGGACSVLLNRQPSKVETYNDLNGEVVNFFRVLRDDGERLRSMLELTPYSREEFERACNIDCKLTYLERARLFFVRCQMAWGGTGCGNVTGGHWRRSGEGSMGGMSQCVKGFHNKIADLPDVQARLLRVQIEHRPAVDVIKAYDSIDTLFYCDPPYPMESRTRDKAYSCEMTEGDHDELASVVANAKGKVAVSGYQCDLMERLYPPERWIKYLAPPRVITSSKASRVTQEALWTNYEPGKEQRA